MLSPCPSPNPSSLLCQPQWRRSLWGTLVGVVLVALLVRPGQAQITEDVPVEAETSAVGAPTDSFTLSGLRTDYVWSQEDLSPEIVNQRQAYRDQLEAYRQQEKNFLIAQDQYRVLGTLDSIEQAVKATRQFLLSRDQVLHTYITLLQLRLMAANGIELSLKTSSLTRLEAMRTRLKDHHDAASGQLDRPTSNRLADEFAPIGTDVKLLTSQVSGLLAVGQLQAVYDKAMALQPQIVSEVTVTDASKSVSPETTRSLEETNRSLEKNKASLTLLWGKVADRITNEGPIRGQSDFMIDLNANYVALTKTLSYFLELLKLFRTAGAAAVS